MELSLLCDIKVFLYLYDQKENKFIHYQSDENDEFVWVQFNYSKCEVTPPEQYQNGCVKSLYEGSAKKKGGVPWCRNFYSNKDVSYLFSTSNVQYDKFLPSSTTPTTVSPEKQEKTTESKKREKKVSTKNQSTPNWDKYYELVDFKGPQQYEPPPPQWL